MIGVRSQWGKHLPHSFLDIATKKIAISLAQGLSSSSATSFDYVAYLDSFSAQDASAAAVLLCIIFKMCHMFVQRPSARGPKKNLFHLSTSTLSSVSSSLVRVNPFQQLTVARKVVSKVVSKAVSVSPVAAQTKEKPAAKKPVAKAPKGRHTRQVSKAKAQPQPQPQSQPQPQPQAQAQLPTAPSSFPSPPPSLQSPISSDSREESTICITDLAFPRLCKWTVVPTCDVLVLAPVSSFGVLESNLQTSTKPSKKRRGSKKALSARAADTKTDSKAWADQSLVASSSPPPRSSPQPTEPLKSPPSGTRPFRSSPAVSKSRSSPNLLYPESPRKGSQPSPSNELRRLNSRSVDFSSGPPHPHPHRSASSYNLPYLPPLSPPFPYYLPPYASPIQGTVVLVAFSSQDGTPDLWSHIRFPFPQSTQQYYPTPFPTVDPSALHDGNQVPHPVPFVPTVPLRPYDSDQVKKTLSAGFWLSATANQKEDRGKAVRQFCYNCSKEGHTGVRCPARPSVPVPEDLDGFS